MPYIRLKLLALISIILTGCAVAPQRPDPVTIVEKETVQETAQTYVYHPPTVVTASTVDATIEDAEAPVVQRKPVLPTPAPTKKASSVVAKAPTVAKRPKAANTVASIAKPKTAPTAATGSSVPVNALLQQAEAQRAAGNLVSSAATLERGVRIDPRNPHLWHKLARIRLQQGLYSQAVNMASKSNSVAGAQSPLAKENQNIIAEARKKMPKGG